MKRTKRHNWAMGQFAATITTITTLCHTGDRPRVRHVSIWIVIWTHWTLAKIASNRWQVIQPTMKVVSVRWIHFIMKTLPPCFRRRHWTQRWFRINFWWTATTIWCTRVRRPLRTIIHCTINWRIVFSVVVKCLKSKPVCRSCTNDGTLHHRYHRRNHLPHSIRCTRHRAMGMGKRPASMCCGCRMEMASALLSWN